MNFTFDFISLWLDDNYHTRDIGYIGEVMSESFNQELKDPVYHMTPGR
jgi:hypothetical protein